MYPTSCSKYDVRITHDDRDVNAHLSGEGWSEALLAANARLHDRRKEAQARPSWPGNSAGWLDALRERASCSLSSCVVDETAERDKTTATDEPASPAPNEEHEEAETYVATVRVYPSLAHAAIQQGCVPALRVWLLLRHLDGRGGGWVETKRAFERLSKKASPLHICGKRRLSQIVREGGGVFWTRRDGRLWLTGAAKLCGRLNVIHLDGRTVTLPLAALTGRLKLCRAHLYATVHSRRRDPAPIARVTLTHITGACERSQREYDALLKVERTASYHLGEKYTTDNLIESHWQHGNGFEFIDAHGRHGRKGASYIARRLGNTYTVTQQAQTATGRKKKINRYLNDLVKKQAQGNEQSKVERLYFPNGAAAVKAISSQRQTTLAYWHSSHESAANNPSRSNSARATTIFFSVGENDNF